MSDATATGAVLIDADTIARACELSKDELAAFLDDWNVCVLTSRTVLDLICSSGVEFTRRFRTDGGPRASMTRAWLLQHAYLCELLAGRLVLGDRRAEADSGTAKD